MMDETAVITEKDDSYELWVTAPTGEKELVFMVSKETWNDDEKRRAFLVQRIADEALELVNMLKNG
jgi:hypothetical protein